MSDRPWRPRLVAGVVSCLLLLLTAPAGASHYRLGESGLVSEQEQAALEAAGIATTIDLLDATAKVRDRRKLAKKTKLAMQRLTELASQCDLLRIDGVGERMARLLRAADIKDVPTLGKQAAESLVTKLSAANKRDKISEITPGAGTLVNWIQQARKLPRLVQGL